jgi:probable F420-dependent oxidoreductase
MEIGVRIPHVGPQATPSFVREWCTTAEAGGYGILWGVDHLVMPQKVESKYILPRKPAAIADDAVSSQLSPNFEMMSTLAYVAGITERVRLGTAVAVLTIRNAVLNARQLATVDRYSNGRLVYGVGIGWLKEEADAMNMPWDRRGARADEHIALLRALWTAAGKHVEFHGEFWDIPPMDPEPKPVQQPIPILIGGHSEHAMARAARVGDGWIAADMAVERLESMLPTVREACDRAGRDFSTLEVYAQLRGEITVDAVRAFEALGVRSLQLPIRDLDELKRVADDILPKLS